MSESVPRTWPLGRGGFELDARDVAPQVFEAVVRARLRREDVQHDVEVVADDPRRLALAVDGARQQRARRRASAASRTSSQIALHLARVAARADDEEVGVDAHRPHVEDHDVVRQLVLGDAGDPAGLFERAQAPSAYPGSPAVQPEPLDLVGDRRRHEVPSIGAPSGANLRMSLDEIGIGSMSKNSTRSGRRSSREDGVELLARIAGPRRDAEAHVLEDLVRLAPGEELRELVGADEEDRVVAEARSPCRSSTDGRRGRRRRPGTRAASSFEPRLDRRRRRACAAGSTRRARAAGRGRSAASPSRRAARDRCAAG